MLLGGLMVRLEGVEGGFDSASQSFQCIDIVPRE